jgi:hypothetical protein
MAFRCDAVSRPTGYDESGLLAEPVAIFSVTELFLSVSKKKEKQLVRIQQPRTMRKERIIVFFIVSVGVNHTVTLHILQVKKVL